MPRHRWRWLLVGALLGVALAVYFEPTRRVRGWLWGEAFFEDRPSSFWRDVIVRDLESDPRVIEGTLPPPLGTWWTRGLMAVGIRHEDETSFRLVQSPAADAVLHELERQGDRRVAGFARDVLQDVRPRQPFPGVRAEFGAWSALLVKHRGNPEGALP